MLELNNQLALFLGKRVAGKADAGVADSLQRFAQAHGGALGRGGGVVQFMRQTR